VLMGLRLEYRLCVGLDGARGVKVMVDKEREGKRRGRERGEREGGGCRERERY
jgi:hypothetical protein